MPLWFHTFALNREHGLYTPGVARDHRYRVPFLPASFAGERVLDVGTFDGFYAFLAEHRGAARVVAVDNEQYVAWVRARWGSSCGEARASRRSPSCSARAWSTAAGTRSRSIRRERFDVVFCFGILHRVENPLGLLRRLAALLAPGGRLLVETYGVASDGRLDAHTIEVSSRRGASTPATSTSTGGSAPAAWAAIAELAGLTAARVDGTVVVDGHPRIMATLDEGALDGTREPRAQAAGSSVVTASTPSAATRCSSAASFTVPGGDAQPAGAQRGHQRRESRKCSTHTPDGCATRPTRERRGA